MPDVTLMGAQDRGKSDPLTVAGAGQPGQVALKAVIPNPAKPNANCKPANFSERVTA